MTVKGGLDGSFVQSMHLQEQQIWRLKEEIFLPYNKR